MYTLGKAGQINEMALQHCSHYFQKDYKYEEKIILPKYIGYDFAYLIHDWNQPSKWLEFILK